MRTSRIRRFSAAGAALVLVTLGACSGGAADSGSAPTAAEVPEPSSARDGLGLPDGFVSDEDTASGGEVPQASGGAGKVTTAEIPLLESPDLVKTATVSVVEEDLAAARDIVDDLLRKYGGVVSDEKTVNDTKGKTETSQLVIRVPVRSFGSMMSDLEENLQVKTSTTDTEDVHNTVIDVESRLANLRVSLGRLRAFLRDATDLNAMLQFEQRITNVESQIASLTAQREYLNDQTTMSTINLDLRTPTAPPPTPKKDDPLEGAGFFTGLDNGWQALKDVLLVGATIVGAVVPFAILGIVLGAPLWVALRRNRKLVHEVSET
ncbi:MAG TPA: DUF4349 domain-containing protein [Nocardioidaceae bacterium]|nr:DUF4349 domain-containing protein [Nocardioidaceae bacterium]